jgi:beta-glucanase (GH16 family)
MMPPHADPSTAHAVGSRPAARTAAVAIGLLLAAPAALSSGRPDVDRLPPARLPGWHRVFVDDFTKGLSAARWHAYSGQPGGDPGGFWAPSHAVAGDGVLRLRTYRDRAYARRWVSAGVSSARALTQTYGKYLVRFRMDHGRGVAGVLLLWPSSNRWPPEIDFAEDGGEGTRRDEMSATLHYGADDNQIQRTLHADFTQWHTIGVEWTPGKLAYTIDGRRWAVVRSDHVPRVPMELDLQTQAGTCGHRFSPCPDGTTPHRVDMHVDWVAAYAYRPRARR